MSTPSLALSLYPRLPIILQNVACSLEGLRVERQRYGGGYDALAQAATERASWNDERLREFRDARLRDFVARAARNVPHYRRLFSRLGLAPDDIRSLADLSRLPILTKDEVKADPTAFFDPTFQTRDLAWAQTSGTTGTGLRFRTTWEALQERWAVWWRYRGWHGIGRNDWCALFGSRQIVPLSQTAPPFWRYNVPGREIRFSSYHLSERNLPAYVNELRRRQPPWIHGYPSALSLVAAHLVESGTDLGYNPRSVTIGSENLLPQQVSLMARGFGVRPQQSYGMHESAANFSGCGQENLHVDEDFAAVEFVPDGTEGGCRVIGTNLSNSATPLIRYDIGDVATPIEGPCLCGRPGRVISRVDGRQEDFVVLESGARVGRLSHLFKKAVNIREAQIHQSKIGEIVIRVVRSAGWSAGSETVLLREAKQYLGATMKIQIQYVPELPRTTSGKLRLVVSDLRDGALLRSPKIG
ncbi:MAG: phenylacetate--CoA ligase family protein [Elusimicrobia bacterium]|nr:phenylacetate--CoA ligase family protein [Elusimicrobiota bacterium]